MCATHHEESRIHKKVARLASFARLTNCDSRISWNNRSERGRDNYYYLVCQTVGADVVAPCLEDASWISAAWSEPRCKSH